ncbi:synaptic glycoprotein SC2-like protein [Heterostelium album PN500]|uniref:Synaptic glycoprotein SC2-like protein n=1 Tax=Heterostelium pallidum (strain ATCC 26659 / Pp 5 / PN500) TaxID=670386 RepID=D3BB44_HETP5|nr:synaptic glycoprotein SC2-like protein [Heterostelium album PN500]EFA81781.1 synaptic glycoprotein SC2-like protein [Heterostelium album PN500]|eukprot:XP_020433898.1 synaptic glycoprotein SC2-like protein [Heterostelium album PN500]
MRIKVLSSGSKREICTVSTEAVQTVGQFKKEFYRQNPKYSVERQRFSIIGADSKPIILGDDSKTLASYNLKLDDTLYFKDLGPQISWTAVFLAEYAGPLLIYPLFYYFSTQIYGYQFEKSYVQQFSHGTMPLFNLFKNCTYYWGCTVMVSYFVNHSLYTAPAAMNVYLGLVLFAIGESMNLVCHLQLRNLRPAGSTARAIPKGGLFEFVSCPNYTMEILSWIGFSIMTQTLTAYIFTILGAVQMYVWAVAKHRKYRKDFDGQNGRLQYPRSRKIIVPFLL